jgi:hypothetical protein
VGKPFATIAEELLGQSVVVAIYSTQAGALGGVILTKAKDRQTLDSLVQTWNRQKSISTEAVKHGGETYFRRARQRRSGTSPQMLFYAQFENTFALSDKESMIRRVVDLHAAVKLPATKGEAAARSASSLDDSELFHATQRDFSDESFARIYFNPKSCSSSANLFSNGKKDPLRALAAACWQRCDAIGASARFDEGFIAEINFNFDATEVPAEWTSLLKATQGPPEFLTRVPRGASVTAAGRIDLASLVKLISPYFGGSEEGKWSGVLQVGRGLLLGLDPLTEVLPALGHNWTFFLVPDEATRNDDLPADALLAVELPASSNERSGNRPALRDALDNALNTGFNYLATKHNGKSEAPDAIVKTSERGPVRVRWIEGLDDIEPACALTPDALVLSTSRRLVDQLMSAPEDDSLTKTPFYQHVANRYLKGESQLVVVNVAAVRDFAMKHLPPSHATDSDAAKSAATESASKSKRVDSQVLDVLKLFDLAFLGARLHEDRVHVVAGAALLPAAEETAWKSADETR